MQGFLLPAQGYFVILMASSVLPEETGSMSITTALVKVGKGCFCVCVCVQGRVRGGLSVSGDGCVRPHEQKA